MERYVYFNNENGKFDHCCGATYLDFLEYAFSTTDFFMLVFVNYYGKGYTKIMKEFYEKLKPFIVKKRTNPSWPGTLETYCKDTSYKIVFYHNNPQAKEILMNVNCLSAWSSPNYPQDLAFFKGNKCWLYSVGHEKMACIINPTIRDLDFVEKNGLAIRSSVGIEESDYFSQFNEDIE